MKLVDLGYNNTLWLGNPIGMNWSNSADRANVLSVCILIQERIFLRIRAPINIGIKGSLTAVINAANELVL